MAVLLVTGAVLQSTKVYADNGYDKQKVVYHINYDDPKKQAGALRNIPVSYTHLRAHETNDLIS